MFILKYTGWSSRTCSPPFAEGKDEETRVIPWHTLAPGPELAANWLLRPHRLHGGADTGAGRGAPRKMLPPRSHVHLTPSLWQRLAGYFSSAGVLPADLPRAAPPAPGSQLPGPLLGNSGSNGDAPPSRPAVDCPRCPGHSDPLVPHLFTCCFSVSPREDTSSPPVSSTEPPRLALGQHPVGAG